MVALFLCVTTMRQMVALGLLVLLVVSTSVPLGIERTDAGLSKKTG